MNLYHISQDVNNEWGTYSDAVVAAENEEQERKIHPAEYVNRDWWTDDWSSMTWVENLEQVQVKFIGVAVEDIEAGVICASLHAG